MKVTTESEKSPIHFSVENVKITISITHCIQHSKVLHYMPHDENVHSHKHVISCTVLCLDLIKRAKKLVIAERSQRTLSTKNCKDIKGHRVIRVGHLPD